MRVYFISGLGADKSVFQFLDLSYCQPVFIDWIKPQHDESLKHYALRIKEAYAIPGDAIITGLSFGGMLATEIAKAFPQTKAVLLSSSKTKDELPAFYKLGKPLPVYKWPPNWVQRQIMFGLEKRFGIISPRGKEIYRGIVKRANISFNKWAVWAILHWDNTTIPANVVHIHGTADRILPISKVKANVIIKNAGHLMVIENAAEVSLVLRDKLTA
ncbi:MAG TPA: alpha/beta hydrolase [Chitinophagaceae bacterium]|nr:alpha/beta hydrolase [Chitinophagaceae bacterium]